MGNGFGQLAGSTQVDEMGDIETPIVLTSTTSVPRVADAVISYMLAMPGNADEKAPAIGVEYVMWPQTKIVSTGSEQARCSACPLKAEADSPISPISSVCRVAFQRWGGTAASRTTDGGVATLASVLTRSPAGGALLLAKSVFISTF